MTRPQRTKLPHAPPAWVRDGAVYFVTICTAPRGQDHLCNERVAALIRESLEFNLARGIWWPHLALLMPDHFHGLFAFAREPGMQKAVADWKHYMSRTAGIPWQRDFFDHRLRTDESLDEKAAYIRQNPVRAKLVSRAEQWPYVWSWPTRISIAT